MPMSIEVAAVGKRYRVGESPSAYQTLRETIASRASRQARRGGRDVWAVRDVTLEVAQGESLGVIGRNGAGKSTLLKLVAHITQPTTGVVRTRGRVSPLLEVGTGFHPELTGRENVFLNGVILGMSRRGIRRRFDEIVEFSGVARFLDTPLKRYSSGMYLRLAFAVAAHLDPPILAVDEILAVGDAEFRRKCLGRMNQFSGEGRTVLFVSHDLGAVAEVCRRAVWLDRGRVIADGATADVVERYLSAGVTDIPHAELVNDEAAPVKLTSVALADGSGAPVDRARRDQPLGVVLRLRTEERVPGFDVAVYLVSRQGVRVVDEAWSDRRAEATADEPGEYEVQLTLPPILAAGDYALGVWLGTAYDTLFDREVLSFHLWPSDEESQEAAERRRLVRPDADWRVTPLRRVGAS